MSSITATTLDYPIKVPKSYLVAKEINTVCTTVTMYGRQSFT